MSTMQQTAPPLRPDEIAARLRQYHELMEPHIRIASRLLAAAATPPSLLMSEDGNIVHVDRAQAEVERMAHDYITDTSRIIAKTLSLGDFVVRGS